MPKLCPQEDDSPSNLSVAGLRLFDTDSNYQKQMSLSVWEAKEAREATEAEYTTNRVRQKQSEISIKMALCNTGYFFQVFRKISLKNKQRNNQVLIYLFLTRRNILRT